MVVCGALLVGMCSGGVRSWVRQGSLVAVVLCGMGGKEGGSLGQGTSHRRGGRPSG